MKKIPLAPNILTLITVSVYWYDMLKFVSRTFLNGSHSRYIYYKIPLKTYKTKQNLNQEFKRMMNSKDKISNSLPPSSKS